MKKQRIENSRWFRVGINRSLIDLCPKTNSIVKRMWMIPRKAKQIRFCISRGELPQAHRKWFSRGLQIIGFGKRLNTVSTEILPDILAGPFRRFIRENGEARLYVQMEWQ